MYFTRPLKQNFYIIGKLENLDHAKNILFPLSKIINIWLGKEATMSCRFYFIFKKVLFFIYCTQNINLTKMLCSHKNTKRHS